MYPFNNQTLYLVKRGTLAGFGNRRRPVLGRAWDCAVHQYLDGGGTQLTFGLRSGRGRAKQRHADDD